MPPALTGGALWRRPRGRSAPLLCATAGFPWVLVPEAGGGPRPGLCREEEGVCLRGSCTGVPAPDMETHSRVLTLQRPSGDGSGPQPSGKPGFPLQTALSLLSPTAARRWAAGVVNGFPFLN